MLGGLQGEMEDANYYLNHLEIPWAFGMSLQESKRFRVEAVIQTEDQPPQMRLVDDAGQSLQIQGAILEAQYNINKNTVLFIAEDCPYEETLHILYVDDKLSVLDVIQVSANYTPGILKINRVIQPNEITFSFFESDEHWNLTVLDEPTVQLWANSHPIKRPSPFLHRQWLALKAVSTDRDV